MAQKDLRDWIAQLEAANELRKIEAEVNWDCELGAVARRVLEKKGPALLFNAITDYRDGPATQVFKGMEVVEAIVSAPKDSTDKPLTDIPLHIDVVSMNASQLAKLGYVPK